MDVKRKKLMKGKSTGAIKNNFPERKSGSGSSETTDYRKICQAKTFLYMPLFLSSLPMSATAESQRQDARYGRLWSDRSSPHYL